MITIERNGTTITTDDVGQAAALINALAVEPVTNGHMGAARAAAPRKPRAPRAIRGDASPPKEGKGALRAKLLAFLGKHPAASIAEIAQHLYAAAGEAERARVHSAISLAVRSGSLKRLANGEYRVP